MRPTEIWGLATLGVVLLWVIYFGVDENKNPKNKSKKKAFGMLISLLLIASLAITVLPLIRMISNMKPSKQIIGTWTNASYDDTFIFHGDGTVSRGNVYPSRATYTVFDDEEKLCISDENTGNFAMYDFFYLVKVNCF